jgi:uncharacterized ion transporter superfamily protein YfcC
MVDTRQLGVFVNTDTGHLTQMRKRRGMTEIFVSAILLVFVSTCFALSLAYYIYGILYWDKKGIWYPLWLWIVSLLMCPLFLITLFDGIKKYRESSVSIVFDESFSAYGNTNTEDDVLTEVSTTSNISTREDEIKGYGTQK